MGTSIHNLLHFNSVNMSAVPHCQVGDKLQWSDNMDYVLTNFRYVITSTYVWANCDETLGKPKRFSCTVRQMITLHKFQYSYSIMTGSATVLLYWLYKLYWSGGLEEVHRGNACSYRICTEMVLEWHCLLCSRAIDCCSTGATVPLYAMLYSDRLLFYRCYSGTVWCAVQR